MTEPQRPPTPHTEASTEDEDTGFHDYTIATALEKLIADIETAVRHIIQKEVPRRNEMASGSGAGTSLPTAYTTHLSHRLPFRDETYALTVHLPAGMVLPSERSIGIDSGHSARPSSPPPMWPLGDQPHSLQEWFLPHLPCLVLAPDSYSGRILDDDEATTVLSAGAAALAHLHLRWPVCVPVHDALRDAYRGIATGVGAIHDSSAGHPGLGPAPGPGVMRFESDSVHSSRSLPDHISHPVGQLHAFASRLRCHSPAAASFCTGVAAEIEHQLDDWGAGGPRRVTRGATSPSLDRGIAADARAVTNSTGADAASRHTTSATHYALQWSLRRSYLLPSPDAWGSQQGDKEDEDEVVVDGWDQGAPWRPWATHDDPLSALELDALWTYHLPTEAHELLAQRHALVVDQTGSEASDEGLDMTSPFHDPERAGAWRLAALQVGYLPDEGKRPLMLLHSVDQRRKFLRLQSIGCNPMTIDPLRRVVHAGRGSFHGMLEAMCSHAPLIAAAKDAGALTSDAWWLSQGDYVPPHVAEHVVQDALRDVFGAPLLRVSGGGLPYAQDTSRSSDSDIDSDSNNNSDINTNRTKQRGTQPVGKAAPLSSLTTRLALHALRLGNPRAVAQLWSKFLRELRFAHWEKCIRVPRMGANSGTEQDPVGATATAIAIDTRHCLLHQKLSMLDLCIQRINEMTDSDPATTRCEDGEWSAATRPQGVLEVTDTMLVRHPDRRVHVPVTQHPPPCTEDVLLERAMAIHEARSLSTQHDQQQKGDNVVPLRERSLLLSDMQAFKAANPGCGIEDFVRWHSPRDWSHETQSLSRRMGDPEGVWSALWNAAVPLPAALQRPLFQPDLEGERALHDLEMLPPPAVHAALLATGFAAALGLLERSQGARLPAAAAQLQRLRDIGNTWLADGVAPCAAGQDLSSDEGAGARGTGASLTDATLMQTMISYLGCVEATVVAAHSIIQRLGGDVRHGTQLSSSVFTVANDLINAALAHGSGCGEGTSNGTSDGAPGLYGTIVDITRPQFESIIQKRTLVGAEDTDRSSEDPGGAQRGVPVWDPPFWTEWSIDIGTARAAGGHAVADTLGSPVHRMFVRMLPAEVRVATVITDEQ